MVDVIALPVLVLAGYGLYIGISSTIRLLPLRQLVRSFPLAQRVEVADLDPFALPLYCRLEGQLEIAQPLIAPVSGQPCLWYHVEVIPTAGAEQAGVVESATTPFTLRDRSGSITIDPAGMLVEARRSHPLDHEPERVWAIGSLGERQLSYADWKLHHAWKQQTKASDSPLDPAKDPTVVINEWIIPLDRVGTIYAQPTRINNQLLLGRPVGEERFYLATAAEQLLAINEEYRRRQRGVLIGCIGLVLLLASIWFIFIR
jgi:hypothetical protein